MSLGALAFLNPWLLAGLASLPLIYWLLRTVPPQPTRVNFPPTRILVGLENREKTPAKTPWWLMLIRLLAAAAVILALAEPVLNPRAAKGLRGTGPVVIVADNGWAAAPRWSERAAMIERLIGEAEAANRPVLVIGTAASAKAPVVRIEAPREARSSAAALQPQPFNPDRAQTAAALELALAPGGNRNASVVWLTDGLDNGDARAFAEKAAALAGQGSFTVIDTGPGTEPLGLNGTVGRVGKLQAAVIRSGGQAREGTVTAYSARGAALGETRFTLAAGAKRTETTFELPLELRNQVARLEIAGERSAGAVSLLDSASNWHRIGLISGENREEAQPLLAALYYIDRALSPFAEIVRPPGANLEASVRTVLRENAAVLVLADIGTLDGEVKAAVDRWVTRGGVLVRFAGLRLEKGGDDLLPVGLRVGGRSLGGALSWSTPQPLAPFDGESLFNGLTIPADVTVNRQVLADPAQIGPEVRIWARLKDGTPLVTAARHGQGQIVLFHVTANSDWSSLPISGLFVDMLRRITTLARPGGVGPDTAKAAAGTGSGAADTTLSVASADKAGDKPAEASGVLAPVQTLDGFGLLRAPPSTAQGVLAADVATLVPGLDHPPGLYGSAGTPRAVNVIKEASVLEPLPSLPQAAERRGLESSSATILKPWLLALALGLLFADILAVLALQAGLRLPGRARSAPAALALLLASGLALGCAAPDALAQESFRGQFRGVPDGSLERGFPGGIGGGAGAGGSIPLTIPPGTKPDDATAMRATSKVTLGYVLTGNTDADETSRLGLKGLTKILALRTAVEPGEPIAIDIARDEIAFYPVLYWPVLNESAPLPEPSLSKIDAYMKQGGLIVFDTRDYGTGMPAGLSPGGKGGSALQRLLGRLDIPRLEPVPETHVLTKSFYLLRTFPGRWDGGQLWVEADQGTSTEAMGSRKASRADGVTSIIVTSNDLASAWAMDPSGRGLYPVVPGGENQREMAFRAGVNIVMHALTGNYKADQVHVPALLERLGQ